MLRHRKHSGRVRRRFRVSRAIFLLLAVLAAARIIGRVSEQPLEHRGELLREGVWRLERVVDGDTLIIRDAENPNLQPIRVRLLGIDTPETVKPNHPIEPWGAEATTFTRRFLRGGELHIRLDRRRIDQYGRSLAYVYVGHQMLNAELVRNGFARVSVFPGDSAAMSRKLRRAEQAAKDAQAGIWSDIGIR